MEPGTYEARQLARQEILRLAHPRQLLRSLTAHHELLRQLTRREILGRYRGSYLGVAWALLTPLASLAVYTFVFTYVFEARWGDTAAGRDLGSFAVTLFTGMVAYNLFGESLVNSPYAITRNPNFVTKVVFPLEILPATLVGAATFHSFIGMAIVILASVAVGGHVSGTILYLPLVYIPLVALTAGVSWAVAALGVFLRDIGHMAGVAVQLLFFLTPILYPVSALPESVQPWMRLNPLATIVEDFRRVILWSEPPDWPWFCLSLVGSIAVMIAGYTCFMSLRRAFADVL
jgi:lipopolysaccharide transport system permease protein